MAGITTAADRVVEPDVVDAAAVVGTDTDRDGTDAVAVGWDFSSSFDLRRSGISTLSEYEQCQASLV